MLFNMVYLDHDISTVVNRGTSEEMIREFDRLVEEARDFRRYVIMSDHVISSIYHRLDDGTLIEKPDATH